MHKSMLTKVLLILQKPKALIYVLKIQQNKHSRHSVIDPSVTGNIQLPDFC